LNLLPLKIPVDPSSKEGRAFGLGDSSERSPEDPGEGVDVGCGRRKKREIGRKEKSEERRGKERTRAATERKDSPIK